MHSSEWEVGIKRFVHPAGFLFAAKRLVWVPVGILCSAALTSTGFVLQTCGLKDGNTIIVCTCAAVSSMVTGVAVGLVALGETMPTGVAARVSVLVSWLLIALGVTGLANGKGAHSFVRVPLPA